MSTVEECIKTKEKAKASSLEEGFLLKRKNNKQK